MSEIFVSYAREDREHAKTLAMAFEKFGWTVWWDKEIPAGKVFDEVIEEKLNNAKCVIVLWTSNSIGSRWVKLEAQEGANRSILVPVMFEEIAIPLAFRNIQAANLVGWDGVNHTPSFYDLAADISALLGKPAPRPESSPVKHDETVPPSYTNPKPDAAGTHLVHEVPKQVGTDSETMAIRKKKNLIKTVLTVAGIGVGGLLIWVLFGRPKPNIDNVIPENPFKPTEDATARVDDSIWNASKKDTILLKNFIAYRPTSRHMAEAGQILDSIRKDTKQKLDSALNEKTAKQKEAFLDSINIRGVVVSDSLTIKNKISTLESNAGWKKANGAFYDSALQAFKTIDASQATIINPATDFVTSTGVSGDNSRPVGVTNTFRVSAGGAVPITVFVAVDAHNGAETLTISLNPPNANPAVKTVSVGRSAKWPTWRQFSVTQPGDYELKLTNQKGNLIGHINFKVI